MAMLRSSKFLRYFTTLGRGIVTSQQREIDGTLVHKSQTLASYAQKDFLATAASVRDNRNIDKSIKRLDQDVRRMGRISRRELQEVIDEIRLSQHATSTQSLMIIRCCGSLVPEESPEIRTKLVNEVWQTFENLGVIFDISHYNALLRVYLENEHRFSPSEFLADLETKGVEPNRVTFQRLIAAYCQWGDIEGATHILEFMKEKQMPVNESVFNALITGHSQADDMESARGILGVMKQAGVEPSTDTYRALLCGYAKKGDVDSIGKVLQECKAQDIGISDVELLEVVYTLAVNKHHEQLGRILSLMTKSPGYNQDAKNTVLRLIARGEDDAALEIFHTMTPPVVSERFTNQTGFFLLKQMIRYNRPFEKLMSICDDLLKYNDRILHATTEASLIHGQPELSLKLLKALAQKEPVCQHYYWPVIVKYGKANNREGILSVLRQMPVDIGQPVSGETLREYVVKYMSPGEAGVHELRQSGISLASAAVAVVTHTLQKKDMKNAVELALRFRANYNTVGIHRALISAYLSENDVSALVTLVRIMGEGNPGTALSSTGGMEDEDGGDEAAGRVLLGLVSGLRNNRTVHLVQILQKYLEHGLSLSNSNAELLQNKLKGDELTQEISTLLTKLTAPDRVATTINRPQIKPQVKLDEESLFKSIAAIEAGGECAKGLKRQLLTLYCYNRDLEKALALKKEMDAEGSDYPIGLRSLIMDLYTQNDMLPEAMECYKEMLEKDNNFQLDESKLIRLATLLVKNNRVKEAIELIKGLKLESDAIDKTFTHSSLCWKLLNTLAEMGNVEDLNNIFEIMKENNFISPTNVLLGPLIKVHILKGDVKSALEKFEECCVKYRATPWKNEIACKLIEEEDATALQRLTDLSTQIHGEVNSLYDLVLSFVECGRIRQARKILETPGLKMRSQRINSACERYKNEGHINHLENLVEVTKDMPHINRADIYYHLLLSYDNMDEVDKGLGLWTQMQDEDVQPSDMFLIKLAKLLEKHNKPIPFAVPDPPPQEEPRLDVESQKKSQNTVQSRLKALRRAVYLKDLELSLDIKMKLNDSDLPVSDRSALLNLMVNSGRLGEATKMLVTWLESGLRPNIRAFNAVINSIAKVGDIDSLKTIGKLINEEDKKKISFSNRLTHCMVEAGLTKELLDSIEATLDSADTPEKIAEADYSFPKGGIFSVFVKSPELIPRCEKIAEKYRSKGILGPTNSLWNHYMMTGQREKAAELWSHLSNCDKLMFQSILKQARKDRDIDLATHLLEFCSQSKISKSALGLIHSCLIDVLFLQDRFKESVTKLDEALKVVSIEDISHNLLTRMKTTFEACNIPFNYTIPPKKKLKADSSSSSDSDTETPKEIHSVQNL